MGLTAMDARATHTFDFTKHVERLAADVSRRASPLSHIDTTRVAFSWSQTRKAVSHGIYATLTPLRFRGGALAERRGRQTWVTQRVIDRGGRDYLYLMTFYLPRFLNCPAQEKLETLIHEMWHIGPRFDGDLRRHAGRCYAHGPSQAAFDAKVASLTRAYLAASPPEELMAFLRYDHGGLCRQYGRVVGRQIPRPKLLPQR
jgi:hypothetical protein